PDGIRSVLELARDTGISLPSTCGGKKGCGKCRIIVEKSDVVMNPPSPREKEILGEDLLQKGYRLACETTLSGGAIIRVPEESHLKNQIILTSGTDYPYAISIKPEIRSYYVEVPPPSLNFLEADRERLLSSLHDRFGLKGLWMDPFVLRELPATLHSREKGVSAVVRNNNEIIAVKAGIPERLLGIAIDVGTTTVVGYLMDLLNGETLSVKSDMNPQLSFGDDLISRISYCQTEPEGLERLRSSIVQCLNTLIIQAASEAKIHHTRILEMTLVGNTAMHHLFMGLDPRYLSMAPYAPVLTEAQDVKARDLGIHIGPSSHIHLLPLKAGFVGSDAIACVLATGIHKKKTITLLLDLGTNGEVILGNRDRLFCCSTAAGPAFEGGHIRWGMRAAAGAIERIKIDPITFETSLKTIHHHLPIGICGSGIISAVAEMIRAGIVLARGNFNEELPSHRLRQGEYGREFVLVWSQDTGHGQDIVITQKDVAELQMAKSAIYAGATLMMELLGNEKIQRVLLAGAFGNYTDPLDACAIGLFPGCAAADIVFVGNAAGHGSCLALLDRTKRKEAERIAKKLEYQELAANPGFQDLFVSSMFFSSAQDYEDVY
ncbi:MAG: ASKHA domain-containing protein, partial [Pseudomonadota bacterium]